MENNAVAEKGGRGEYKNKNSVKEFFRDKCSASATHHTFYVLNIMPLLTTLLKY
jgi:hypothetical protein